MDEKAAYLRLSKVFSEVFDDDNIELKPTLTASDVDGWDSFTHIRLMLTVEKTFNVKFTTSELGKLNNVGDLVSLILRKSKSNPDF